MTSKHRFELIIFDLGNTLLYFDGHWPDVFKRADQALLQSLLASGLILDDEFATSFRSRLERYYIHRDTEYTERTSYRVLHDLLAEKGHTEVPESILRQALADLHAVSQEHWLPEVDAVPTLQALKADGYRLGVISNASDHADVQTLIDKAELRPYLEMILTSAGEGIRKPNPNIYRKMLYELKVFPARAVMVGDNLNADVLGAQNTGIFGVWINRRADKSNLQNSADQIHPDATISKLDELPALLAGFSRP